MSYTNKDYKNFILDQLRLVAGISERRLFGGYGLYNNGRFFGIISSNRLFFKTNKKTRKKYIKLGSSPFSPSSKQILKNYYEVPAEIIEDPEKLKEWAEEIV